MGNDGGSIPTRRELVNTGPRAPTISENKASSLELLAYSWTHCALTDAPIGPASDLPLAADYLGRLFSYEAVVTALTTPPPTEDEIELNTVTHTHANGHSGGNNHPTGNANGAGATFTEGKPTVATLVSFGIRTLRDVVRVYPTPPPKTKHSASTPATSTSASTISVEDCWICPLSRKILGAGTRSVFLIPCGHVFAEMALKELGGGDSCPECGKPLEGSEPESIVVVLATGKEEADKAKARMESLREKGLTHSLKKDKGGGGDANKKKKNKRKERDQEVGEGESKNKSRRV